MFCFSFAKSILLIMGTPESVLLYAVNYLKIYSLSLPALSFYFFGAAILRGLGNSKLPTIAILVSGVLNVILNIITVCMLHLGIVGVALSTDIANILSAIIILITIKHSIQFRDKKLFLKNTRVITKTIKYGLPVGIQGMVFALSNMIIQSAINSFGKEAIAGSNIVFNFECIGYFVIESFNQASINFSSQNYKNKSFERCKKIYRASLLFGVIGCLLVNVLFYSFNGCLVSLFTTNGVVIKYAVTRFTMVLLFQWIAGFYEISGATLRGMGHPFLPSILTIIGTCILRVFWVFFCFSIP